METSFLAQGRIHGLGVNFKSLCFLSKMEHHCDFVLDKNINKCEGPSKH